MRIAVIGSGISGSLAARLLATQHHVTLFEANDYVGGHANTVDVTMDGQQFPVDTGFMVFNRQTYPNFCRLLELLNVASQPSDMSFSVSCQQTNLEYQGSSLNGLFAQRKNMVRPAFWQMLADIIRFNHAGLRAVESGELKDGRTVREFLQQLALGEAFVRYYLVPMTAAIWSTDPRAIMDFPADFLIGFYANHGLLQIRDRPQWRTVVGGSRRYLEALLDPLSAQVRLGCPIESVARGQEQVAVKPAGQPWEHYDHVVFATHADQTLQLLSDASPEEHRILGCFPYQPNDAILHTDQRVMPKLRNAWASWNYQIPSGPHRFASLTYNLSRLQRHASARPILVTLNPTEDIDPRLILRRFVYHHPAYSEQSIQAQREFKTISGPQHRTHFCGAYWGYGFHEDGVNSALAVANDFGIGLEACTAASMRAESGTAVTSR